MKEDLSRTIYVNDDNLVTFTCPKCGKTNTKDVGRLMGSEGRVRVTYTFKCEKCTCGSEECGECGNETCEYGCSNVVYLDRRQSYRKDVNLPGRFSHKDRMGTVVVKDISHTGLKLEFSVEQDFQPGDRIALEFRLDDRKKTFIKKDVIVQKNEGIHVGVAFEPGPHYDHYDSAIGFYLFH